MVGSCDIPSLAYSKKAMGFILIAFKHTYLFSQISYSLLHKESWRLQTRDSSKVSMCFIGDNVIGIKERKESKVYRILSLSSNIRKHL